MKTIDNFLSKKFFIRVLLAMVILTFVLKIAGAGHISDELLLGLMLHSTGLIGLNAWSKKNENSNV